MLNDDDLQRTLTAQKLYLRKSGFTLIELLVVIAVVALLMGILMPVLSKARKQAKTVICQSNLHQWGLTFLMYTTDNSDYFTKSWAESGQETWVNVMLTYYGKEPKIRFCLMATKLGIPPTTCTPNAMVFPKGPFEAWSIYQPGNGTCELGDYGSYGMNGWLYNSLDGEKSWKTINVNRTADIPMLLDAFWLDGIPENGDTSPMDEYDYGMTTGDAGMVRFCVNRHDGFVNGVFFDSSARKIGLKELWKLKWHRKYDINAEPPIWPDWMKKFKDYD
jgi:prepilin-type N-terminal cleavage/methylation domain-containing protein